MEQTKEVSLPRRRSGIARRIFTIILLVPLFGVALFIWWRYYYTYSDGFRFGLLQNSPAGEVCLKPMKVK